MLASAYFSNSINGSSPSSALAEPKPSIQYIEAATSNVISLSSLDRAIVKDRLRKAQNELVVLEAEIARLSLLKPQLAHKEQEIKQLQVAIAPHKDLPNDILHEIFSHLVHDDYCLRLPRSSVIEGPWPLRQVCSRWRRVALSCRSLWDSVHIDTKLPTWCNMDRFATFDFDFAQSWRSKLFCAAHVLPQKGPIRLSFRIFGRTPKLENKLALDALHLLILPYASCIEHLDLDASLTASRPFLEHTRTTDFDSLTSGPYQPTLISWPRTSPNNPFSPPIEQGVLQFDRDIRRAFVTADRINHTRRAILPLLRCRRCFTLPEQMCEPDDPSD